MKILTLIEPVFGGRVRAQTGNPFDISVEANSKAEAIQLVQEAIRNRLANGAEIVIVEIDTPCNPAGNATS